jgi:hypothetical protein
VTRLDELVLSGRIVPIRVPWESVRTMFRWPLPFTIGMDELPRDSKVVGLSPLFTTPDCVVWIHNAQFPGGADLGGFRDVNSIPRFDIFVAHQDS